MFFGEQKTWTIIWICKKIDKDITYLLIELQKLIMKTIFL